MNRKAQSMIEYVVLFAAVVSALLAMQIYFRRSVQGSLRTRADQLSEGAGYAPGETTATAVTVTNSLETSSSDNDASSSSTVYHQESNRSESVRPFGVNVAGGGNVE